MKKCGIRDSCEKGAGIRDQDPLPDPDWPPWRNFAIHNARPLIHCYLKRMRRIVDIGTSLFFKFIVH